MSLSFEVLLIAAILGFYLFDSTMSLYFNDLIFMESRGNWSYTCPSARWLIAGKVPYLSNPLTPGTPLLKVAWSPDAPSLDEDKIKAIHQMLDALRPLRYMASVNLIMMVVVIPAVLLKLGTGTCFFITLGMIYLNIFAMLTLVYLRRTPLEISKKAYINLAFESFACPPFSINMARKISLSHAYRFNPIEFARRYFTTDTFRDLAVSVRARLNEEIEFEDEQSTRAMALKAYSDRLRDMTE